MLAPGRRDVLEERVSDEAMTCSLRSGRMAHPASLPARGILGGPDEQRPFRLVRRPASPALASLVDFYWIVTWDLRGRDPYEARVLAHPCVHLVFEPGHSRIYGVVRGLFSYRLCGAGRVVGVRFRPGAFRPFLGRAVSTITDRCVGIDHVSAVDASETERAVLGASDVERAPAILDAFLCEFAPAPDPTAEMVSELVTRIASDPSLKRVSDLATSVGIAARTLQRLFAEYVGVPPKWVLRRYRLHEAAERANGDQRVDWSRLAAELGYYDQAHLIRDFTATIGAPPARYARAVSANFT